MTWVAADGNAATATSQFAADLGQLDEMVDWPLMHAQRWNNIPEDPDRQRRRMAELLVHGHVPLTVIRGIAAYSDAYAEQARTVLAGNPIAMSVHVRPGWYYGYERRGP